MLFRIVVVVALIGVIAWYLLRGMPPAQRSKALRNWLLIGLGGVLVLLAVSGRAHWLFALLGGLLPFARTLLLRLVQAKVFQWLGGLSLSGAAGAFGGGAPTPGQHSTVSTDSLRMELDHETGALDGEVLRGPFTGRRLADLELDDLLDLLAMCRRDDPQGAALLETYLERVHGAAWQEAEDGERGTVGSAPSASNMTPTEAREILGVAPDADAAAVRTAHRRLIQRLHPDRGGSSFLAAQINRAKELLLESFG